MRDIAAISEKYGTRCGNRVWACQGTVLQGLPGSPQDGHCYEPSVLYEAGAQVLSVDPSVSVFKMWHTTGWGTRGIYYAESLDGITWTKKTGAVVAGYSRGTIIKVGAVYNFFGNDSGLPDGISRWTSTDGVVFTLINTDVLIKGAPGTWDATYIVNNSIVIDGGVWYMIYGGINTTFGVNRWKNGMATSSDGITWVKYAGNPIATMGGSEDIYHYGSPCITKIGSYFYCWDYRSFPSYSAPPLAIGADFYRWKSSDAFTWTLDVATSTYPRTTTDEGVGMPFGLVCDNNLLEVNGKVYMFYAASVDGRYNAYKQRIKLAIAYMTFNELVATDEGRFF